MNIFEQIKAKRAAKTARKVLDELRDELLTKYGVNATGYSIKKMQELLEILENEELFIDENQNAKYSFFGYLGLHEDELPAFFEDNADKDSRFGDLIYPSTPKIFMHCMDRLDKAERLRLSQNLDSLNDMYNDLAKHSKYQIESWRPYFLQTKMKLTYEWSKFVQHNKNKLSVKHFETVNWNKFSRDIKDSLAPSYSKTPSSVQYSSIKKNGYPVAILVYDSITSSGTKEVMIIDDRAYQSVNNSGFDANDELTSVWTKYYNSLLLSTLDSEKTEKSKNSASESGQDE